MPTLICLQMGTKMCFPATITADFMRTSLHNDSVQAGKIYIFITIPAR